MYPVKFGAVSGMFHQVIRKEDSSICAEADVTWASVNSSTKRPSRIPTEFIVDGLKPQEK